MSPHTKGKEQAPVTLENITGENNNNYNKAQGGGGGMVERTSSAEKTQHEGNLNAPNESHDRCSELLRMRMPRERWPLVLKALLVVNSFKLHLNAFKLYDKT